ncbi:ATP-binding cassette domain-containing protein [Candidatus Woesearchaeota archaeon]|nr:ATP-binding cassette domain-containing protein [Candidatus Woesearchaeota archaeon]
MNNEKIIQVKSLTKKYRDFKAVDDISFEVRKGQIFGFLGPNGAGKSTTIKMLTTLLHPNGGEIMIDGKNPVSQPDAVRKAFGIVFQDPSLDDELTAWENMEFHGVLYSIPKPLRRQRIEHMLKIVELWERKDELVKRFSGGMKRRLEIARGLLHHPKVLFLDEPTLGLDPQTRNNIWNHIIDLNKEEDITVFFTTHYMEEAEKVADYICIIDLGKIIAKGSPGELKSKAKARSLEDAFIKLTGKNIREEEAKPIDKLRMRRRVFGGRR